MGIDLATPEDGDLPLAGVRVVDFSRLLAGPSCAMALADLGADVVKVEPPEGDSSRTLGTDGTFFAAVNRNKRSISLDLKDDEQRRVARDLALGADVVIEGFRPGAMDALGLGGAALRAERPELVYASVNGFGSTGPERRRGGIDALIQAEGGLMELTGEADGPPLKCGFMVVDMVASLALGQAIVAALVRRWRTGRGATIEVRLMDCALFVQAYQFTEFSATGVQPPRTGNSVAHAAPSDMVRTADGYLMVVAYLPRHWERLCRMLDLEWMIDDERFSSIEARRANRAEMLAHLETSFTTRSSDAWIADAAEHDLLIGRIRGYDDIARDPQLAANGTLLEVAWPADRPLRTPRMPYVLDGVPASIRLNPPALGQHTAEVLAELADRKGSQ